MAAQPKAADVKEVVVVFKTHFDIGFTERAGNVVDRYRTTMIDKALDLVDQSRNLPPEHRFVWTVSGWPLEQILWEGQSSQRRERVIRAIREGRLVFHALPFTTHTESLDLEELVRGLGYSSSLARRLNLPLPRDAKMTDVPEHTWIIPTILRHAGVEFLHVGCNGWSSPPEVPDLFWWEGPDGSRVLTMNSGKSYGTGLVPPPGWPYRTWLALMMTGDNQGPPTPDVVKKLLEQAKRDLPGVKVRFGRLSDFADAIVKENATIPVVRADMPDTWIHGIMSLPVETKLARNVRPQIGAAAALDTLLNAWGVHAPALQPGLVRAYEQSLLYGEHTWGFNSAYFGHRFGEEWRKVRATGYYDKLEETWDDHRAYARRAADSVTSLLGPRMAALAQAVKAEGPRLVVFNPLPWRRDALVRGIFRNFTATAVKDVESGEVLPVARSGERFAHMEFMARDLPAMGYRTYLPVAGPKPALPAKADPGAIENEYFRITLDAARGGIRSLVDKRTGRELAAPQAPYALGQYLYERFDAGRVAAFTKAYLKDPTRGLNDFGKLNLPSAADRPYTAAVARDCDVEAENTAVATRALLKTRAGNGLPDTTLLRVSLYPGQPFVDLEWGIAGKTEDPWPEAGWLALPFNIANPVFRLGRLGSIVDPAKDTVRGANHDQFCLNTGASITGTDGKGVILCPLDSPMVSLGQPGGWRYSRTFDARPATVFVNLFNNQWSTNFALWNGGTWTSRVRLWATEGKEADLAMITGSWEARQPVVVAGSDGPAGTLPVSQSGLELSQHGVLVTAFGPNPDGEGTLLRLWEQAGGRGVCAVRLPRGMAVRQAQPLDLRGRPSGKPLPVRGGNISVTLEPFAPISLLLER